LPTTPTFGWPYHSVADPPNGAKLGQDLALAIEATVVAVQAGVPSNWSAGGDVTVGDDLVVTGNGFTLDGFDAAGAWVTWSPTLTNLTLGNGTVTAKYWRLGKIVSYRFIFTLGSTSAVGTSPKFTLPVAPATDYVDASFFGVPVGALDLVDASPAAIWVGLPLVLSGSTATMVYSTEAGGGTSTVISATAPFTWTTSDKLISYGTYETT